MATYFHQSKSRCQSFTQWPTLSEAPQDFLFTQFQPNSSEISQYATKIDAYYLPNRKFQKMRLTAFNGSADVNFLVYFIKEDQLKGQDLEDDDAWQRAIEDTTPMVVHHSSNALLDLTFEDIGCRYLVFSSLSSMVSQADLILQVWLN